jgi:PAS domain S-box-containing protein
MAGLHGMVQDITDWTRTEEALRQSEEKYRLIADNTADHIWIFDMDLNLTYSSPSVVRMKGFTVEETLSHSLHEIMTPASVESVLKRFEKEMALELSGGADPDRIVSFETEEYCKDGSTILVENKATLLRDAEGKPVGILGVSRDITERKQADYALQVSEERFRQLFNNASDAIFLHEVRDDGKPGVFIEVNDAACHKLGYTREELMNMEVSDINTPESNEMIPEIMPALFDKLHVTFECSHQKKDGEVIPVEVATHLFHLNNQNVILSICRDISERKSAEEALTRSERQLADIIDFLPDATFVVDKTGTIIAWNRAIEKMTGVLASDMLGKNNYEYALPFYGERRPILIDLAMQCDTQFPRKYSEFKRDGQQVKSESIIANFRGEDVTLWSIATPLYDQSGRLIGSIESIRDVSERKKTDDALHEALDTLKTVMDSLEAFVYVCDMQTYEILFINRFGRAICGEVIGEKCYRSLQKNQDGPCLFCTNEKIVDEYGNPNGGYVWEFQNTITKRWYQCHDRAIRWIDGRIVRLEISTDITKQKLAEHALKQANRQLNLLSEITRHDILNTVNAMQLLANLVEMKVDITPAAKDFENLETAISVIQSQIEFTRVYQDLGSHNPQWISLHNILTSLPVPQGIRLINNSADIEIFSDPLLNKVFENLLDNSIRHGKTVSTITISSKPGQHDMTIIFEDDGAGIPAAEKEVIFERGYGKNTGFGLFFIREILSITGIIISETGLEGIGVRFEISLPKEMWRYRTDH